MNGDRAWPTPAEWVGESTFPWPVTSLLSPGDSVAACFSVADAAVTRDPGGTAILELELADATGSVVGWLPAGPDVEWLRPGLYIGVRGTIEEADGWSRVRIVEVTPVRVGLEHLALFLPHSPADPAALEQQLDELVGSITDPGLHRLVSVMLGPDEEIGRGFRLAPAAARKHHAYLGGLFEHTVSVATLCDRAARHYGDGVDRDLLVTAALLHDIGKIREIGARAGFPYTDEGKLLGHIVLGLQMVGDAARQISLEDHRRLLLQHLIASHQGRYEWQSPREPCILEAIVLHYVDDLDAKLNHAVTLLDSVDAGWTAWDRSLGRELLRHIPAGGAPPARPEPAARPAAGDSARSARRAAEKKAAGAGRTPTETSAGKPAGRKRGAGRKTGRKKSPPPAGRAGKTKRAAGGRKGAKTGRPAAGRKTRKKPRDTTPHAQQARPPGPAGPGFVDSDTLDMFE